MIDAALGELAAALEQGQSDGLKAYLAAIARFHRYSVGNILLIFSQRADASHVAGFQAWKKLGRRVSRGERGILIRAPIRQRPSREKKASVHTEEDDEARDDDDVHGFAGAYVFDVSQTTGRPLPELSHVRGNPRDYVERLRAFAVERGIAVEYVEALGGADGASAGGRIHLKAGMTPAEECATLAHELGHELLHHDGNDSRPGRIVRETEAEAVAYVVSEAVGLEARSASADYIQLYQGSKATLAASLERIRRTSRAILQGLEQAG